MNSFGRDHYRAVSDAMDTLGRPRHCEVLYDRAAGELRTLDETR